MLKTKWKHKSIALILAVVMLVGMLPVNAFAGEVGTEKPSMNFVDSFDADSITTGKMVDDVTYQWIPTGSANDCTSAAGGGKLTLNIATAGTNLKTYSMVTLNAEDGQETNPTANWDNYSVEMTAKFTSNALTDEYVGLIGRYSGSTGYYACYRNNTNYIYLYSFDANTLTKIRHETLTKSIPSNTEFTLKMTFADSVIKVYLNGEEVLSATDSNYGAGTAGIRLSRGGAAEVYDFEVCTGDHTTAMWQYDQTHHWKGYECCSILANTKREHNPEACIKCGVGEGSARKFGVLYASFADSLIVDNELNDAAWRRKISLSNALKLSAAWDADNLYLGTVGGALSNLKINNVPISNSTAAYEVMIPLSQLGIVVDRESTLPSCNISFTLGERVWDGTLVLDTFSYAKEAPDPNSGITVSEDKWKVTLNSKDSETYKPVYFTVLDNLASDLESPTVVEMDITVEHLPDTHSLANTVTRIFLNGGLNICVIDNDVGPNNKPDEAMLTGLYKDGYKLCLMYWQDGQFKSVTIDEYEEEKQYHFRMEYTYRAGDGTTTDDNDTVDVKYFVNGALVLEAADVKCLGKSFNTSYENIIQFVATENGSTHDESTRTHVIVENVSVSHPATLEEFVKDAVDAVEESIEEIGEVTLGSKDNIEAARAAYDALAYIEKAFVQNYATLTAAEAKLQQLQAAADKAAADAVAGKITDIGTVTLNSEAAIEAARAAYDALTEDQKALVENYATLTAAEAQLKQLQDKATADKAAADAVAGKITDIGTVTLNSKTAIEAARAAYDALTEDQKALVGNYETLTAAEAKLQQLQDKATADKAAADAAADKIADIGTVTLNSKTAIEAARAAYDALTEDQKALVENYATLTAAEAQVKQLQDAADKAAADAAAADAAADKIADIGTVTLNSKAAIEAARAAYEALTADQKALVANYETLTAAEAQLKQLQDAADKAALDKAAADAAAAKIADIGTVTLNSKAAIEAARAAYDALTADQKALVANYETLTAAEAQLEQLQATADKEDLDKAAADFVADKITNIGTVTLNSKAAIEAARAAYDALTADQKALVANYETLTAAEAKLQQLQAAADKAAADKAAADAAAAKITDIGTVTLNSKAAIEAARAAYDALTADQKALVANYATLTAAEAKLEQLQAAADKAAADKAAADAAAAKITAIGTVTLDSKTAIEAARAAYDALTADQKALVANYETLTAAEAQLKALQDAANKPGSPEKPIEIPADKETVKEEAKVEAGSEQHYELDEKLAGKTITIKGEDAYAIIDGKKYEAVDGVLEVKLPVKTGKIPVVIGNAGTKAGTFSITIATPSEDNSDTGDNAAVVLFSSLMMLSVLAAGALLVPDIRKRILQ